MKKAAEAPIIVRLVLRSTQTPNSQSKKDAKIRPKHTHVNTMISNIDNSIGLYLRSDARDLHKAERDSRMTYKLSQAIDQVKPFLRSHQACGSQDRAIISNHDSKRVKVLNPKARKAIKGLRNGEEGLRSKVLAADQQAGQSDDRTRGTSEGQQRDKYDKSHQRDVNDAEVSEDKQQSVDQHIIKPSALNMTFGYGQSLMNQADEEMHHDNTTQRNSNNKNQEADIDHTNNAQETQSSENQKNTDRQHIGEQREGETRLKSRDSDEKMVPRGPIAPKRRNDPIKKNSDNESTKKVLSNQKLNHKIANKIDKNDCKSSVSSSDTLAKPVSLANNPIRPRLVHPDGESNEFRNLVESRKKCSGSLKTNESNPDKSRDSGMRDKPIGEEIKKPFDDLKNNQQDKSQSRKPENKVYPSKGEWSENNPSRNAPFNRDHDKKLSGVNYTLKLFLRGKTLQSIFLSPINPNKPILLNNASQHPHVELEDTNAYKNLMIDVSKQSQSMLTGSKSISQ